MIKFIATLTGSDSPLEEVVLASPKVVELSFDSYPSFGELMLKLEPFVCEVKNKNDVTIGINIIREDGANIFSGTSFADGRMSGVSSGI